MHFAIKTIKSHKYLYLVENARVNGKVVRKFQKYVGSPEKVLELLNTNKPTSIASYSFGKPAALTKAAEEVGLIESINQHVNSGETLPRKGNSKEKRFDKNLIGVGLTTSDHNIPFQSSTFPANKNDSQLFSDLIDNICRRLQEIQIPAQDILTEMAKEGS